MDPRDFRPLGQICSDTAVSRQHGTGQSPQNPGFRAEVSGAMGIHGLGGGAGSLERTRLCEFPCLSGKIQGNFANQAYFGPQGPCKPLNLLRFSGKFPARRNREFNRCNRELNWCIREFAGISCTSLRAGSQSLSHLGDSPVFVWSLRRRARASARLALARSPLAGPQWSSFAPSRRGTAPSIFVHDSPAIAGRGARRREVRTAVRKWST